MLCLHADAVSNQQPTDLCGTCWWHWTVCVLLVGVINRLIRVERVADAGQCVCVVSGCDKAYVAVRREASHLLQWRSRWLHSYSDSGHSKHRTRLIHSSLASTGLMCVCLLSHLLGSILLASFFLQNIHYVIVYTCLQCCDAVGWAAGRLSGL